MNTLFLSSRTKEKKRKKKKGNASDVGRHVCHTLLLERVGPTGAHILPPSLAVSRPESVSVSETWIFREKHLGTEGVRICWYYYLLLVMCIHRYRLSPSDPFVSEKMREPNTGHHTMHHDWSSSKQKLPSVVVVVVLCSCSWTDVVITHSVLSCVDERTFDGPELQHKHDSLATDMIIHTIWYDGTYGGHRSFLGCRAVPLWAPPSNRIRSGDDGVPCNHLDGLPIVPFAKEKHTVPSNPNPNLPYWIGYWLLAIGYWLRSYGSIDSLHSVADPGLKLTYDGLFSLKKITIGQLK
jgi:hypothetical protein